MRSNPLIQTTIAAGMLFAAGQAYSAATAFTNGDFQAQTLANGAWGYNITDWYERTTGDFFDWIYRNSGALPVDSNVLGFSSNQGYVYQRIGTYTAGNVIQINGDAYDRDGYAYAGLTIQLFSGNFAGAVDGADIATAPGIVSLDSATRTAADLGLTTGAAAGSPFSITLDSGTSGVDGTDLWIRISSFEAGEAFVDNLTLTNIVVPEPSAALLGSLGTLALLRRRRNA